MAVLVLAPPVVVHNQYCQLYLPQCLLGGSHLRYLFAVEMVSALPLLAKTVSWITVFAAVAFGLRHCYPRLLELGLVAHLATIGNDSQYQIFSSSLLALPPPPTATQERLQPLLVVLLLVCCDEE